MNSMTGYGKATEVDNGKEITVELKSVNHRYLDVSVKLPRILSSYEDLLRKSVSACFERGHIDVFVNYADTASSNKTAVIDAALAKDLCIKAEQLSEQLCIKNDVTVTTLLRSGDVLTFAAADEQQDIPALLTRAAEGACKSLSQMRLTEGGKLKTVLLGRLDAIEEYYKQIVLLAPQVVEDYRKKLLERITEALGGVELDQARLVNEVAFFTDKCNIDEELDRLSAHIAHARDFICASVNNGRKLDFLIQEMNREVNTICSKSNNIKITNLGVELKNEIEKLREQCQNVE